MTPDFEHPEDFDYYESANSGFHRLATAIMDELTRYVEADFKVKISTTTVLGTDLKFLDKFSKQTGGEKLPTHFSPVGAFRFMYTDPMDMIECQPKRQTFYCFKSIGKAPVFVGTILHLREEFEDAVATAASFILSESEEDANAFVKAYVAAEKQYNRDRLPNILNARGNRMRHFRKMDWSDIFLSGGMVGDIRDEVETFFNSKAEYHKRNLEWKRGILLAGNPGNGKTSLCRAIITSSKVPAVCCSMNKGDTFEILSDVEQTVTQNAPCLVIFEDADAVGRDPAIRSRFLNFLDGMFASEGILTIATTNCPQKLDTAFTGRPSRFDSIYVISDPTQKEIAQILKKKLGKQFKESQLKAFSKGLEGLSAAAVQEIGTYAMLLSLNQKKPIDMGLLQASADKVKKHMDASKKHFDTRPAMGFAEPAAE